MNLLKISDYISDSKFKKLESLGFTYHNIIDAFIKHYNGLDVRMIISCSDFPFKLSFQKVVWDFDNKTAGFVDCQMTDEAMHDYKKVMRLIKNCILPIQQNDKCL